MGNEDLLFRRSSIKRRKINYRTKRNKRSKTDNKSNEKQLRVIVPDDIKNGGKPKTYFSLGMPRKRPICDLDAVQRPQNHDKTVPKNCKAFRLDEIDHMIEEFIKLGDKNAIIRVINTLQHALQETSKKRDDVKVNSEKSIEIIKEVPPSGRSVSSQPGDPAKNFQTKSISVHGNSVIMQGVIGNGMTQTSCYLIPIDINNMGRFPGGVQVIGSPPPQVIGAQHRVLNNPSNSPMIIPVNPPQSSSVSSTTTSSNNMSNVYGTPVTTSSGGSTNSHFSLNSNKTHKSRHIMTRHILTSNTNNGASSSVNVNQAADVQTPQIIETGLSQGSAKSSTREKSGNRGTTSNTDKAPGGHPAAPIESILEAQQSTDSLAQVLDQLSHDEMLSIVNILTNNSQSAQPSASTSDSLASDLTHLISRITSDIDEISKLDAEQLSSEIVRVNNLAADK